MLLTTAPGVEGSGVGGSPSSSIMVRSRALGAEGSGAGVGLMLGVEDCRPWEIRVLSCVGAGMDSELEPKMCL